MLVENRETLGDKTEDSVLLSAKAVASASILAPSSAPEPQVNTKLIQRGPGDTCTYGELHDLKGTLSLRNSSLLKWAVSMLPFAPERDVSSSDSKQACPFALNASW